VAGTNKTRRQAFYSNLRPGNYRLPRDRSIILVFGMKQGLNSIQHRSRLLSDDWFQGLCVLASTLLWAGYQLRVHQLQEQEKKFATQ